MASNEMKILIGTPIHICKDYCMERWLECVSKLEYLADLLMVDNSPDESYVEKVRGYCLKYGIIKYRLAHVEVNQEPGVLGVNERISQSREIIRREILSKGYDAWCTLECDVIVPPNALGELVKLIGDYDEVNHSYPRRDNSNKVLVDFGVSLVKREALQKYGFIGQYGDCDSEMPGFMHGGERWFMERILRGGGSFIAVHGIIKPIYHLNE